jgi:hypothetical protein
MQRRYLLAGGASVLLGCVASAPPRRVVAEGARRSVLAPRRFGWLSSRETTGALPSAIALGGAPSGRVLLFFEFDGLGESRDLLRAELLLYTGGAPGQGIDIELSRAEAPRGELRAWADQPRALYPRLPARLESAAQPARLDVTELSRADTTPSVPLRVLLRAEPRGGEAGGAAPVLEAYWQ